MLMCSLKQVVLSFDSSLGVAKETKDAVSLLIHDVMGKEPQALFEDAIKSQQNPYGAFAYNFKDGVEPSDVWARMLVVSDE